MLPSEENCYEFPLLLTTKRHPFSEEGEPKQSACSTSGPLIPPLGKGGGKEPSEERGRHTDFKSRKLPRLLNLLYRIRLKGGTKGLVSLFLLLLTTSAWSACSIHTTWGPPFSQSPVNNSVLKYKYQKMEVVLTVRFHFPRSCSHNCLELGLWSIHLKPMMRMVERAKLPPWALITDEGGPCFAHYGI